MRLVVYITTSTTTLEWYLIILPFTYTTIRLEWYSCLTPETQMIKITFYTLFITIKVECDVE